MSLLVICAIGSIISFFAHFCVRGFAKDPKDTKFLGKIPWSLIGVIGYLLIATSFGLEYFKVTYVLIALAALISVWLLIFKAIRQKMMCPACLYVYGINAILVITALDMYREGMH